MPRRGYLYHLLLLTALGAYVYDVVQESVELNKLADAKRSNLRQRKMVEERLLAAQQMSWDQCVDLRMTDIECKEFIDLFIYENFEGKDQYIRTIIQSRRKETDILYNAVTIIMNDDDMAVGRLGDGQVFYDFVWHGSGEAATPEQQAEIPPIQAMEPDANLADIGLEDGSVTVISDYSTEGVVPAPATNSPVAATPAPSPAPVEPVLTGAPTIGILPPAPDPLPPPPPPPAPVSPPPPPPDTDAYTYTGDDAYGDDGYGYYDDTPLPDAPLQVFSEPVTDVTGSTTEQYIEQQSTTTQTITTQAAAVITPAPVPAPAPGVITAAPSPGVVITAAPSPGEATTDPETSPIIAGGVLTDHTAVNTAEGDDLVLAAVSAPVVIPEAGDRVIPPINCAGVTGEDCCLIIKLTVPDSDANGKAIQCILAYAEDTAKKTYWSDLRGKKVHIKGNHNGYVMQNPKVTGNWPAGKEGAEFEQWLLQAGAPPLKLQNLEHQDVV